VRPPFEAPSQTGAAAEASGFGALLRQHRLAAGLTQEELAGRAGLSTRGLSDLERGVRRAPYLPTVRRLAAALGLSESQRTALAAAGRPGDPAAALVTAGGAAAPARPTLPFPLPLTSFVGREREAAEVRALLGAAPGDDGGRPRLLTLTGAGGIGKTRLALSVAAAAGAPDGSAAERVFVPLGPLSGPELVPQAVAAAVGVREEPGRLLAETLVAALAPRPALLLLDNCEHVVGGCAELVEVLLAGCPDLQVLATSREPLGVLGESVWPVPPLTLPEAQPEAVDREAVERLGESAAVRLFVERARAARPDFALTEGTAPAVAEICRRLDGIPLALELAAARVRVLGVAQLAARLDDRLGLLTGGSRTAPPRQQTLRGALDWSYEPLSPPERALFDRLAVFAGGWTLEAAEAVCAAGEGDAAAGIARGAVLDLLARLADRSLVLVQPAPADAGVVRYRLLEPLREYAAERLAARGAVAVAAARRRHAACFTGLAEASLPGLAGPQQVAWLARLDAEHANLRAALTWCAGALPADGAPDAGPGPSGADPDRVRLGLRLAGSLAPFWRVHGDAAEGRRWLDRVLRLRAALPAAATAGPADAALYERALLGAGILAREQGDWGPARSALQACLGLSRAHSGAALRARALAELGQVLLDVGEVEHARPLLEESAALVRAGGDARDAGESLVHLAALAEASADFAAARRLLEDALATIRPTGDDLLLGAALIQLVRRDIIAADFDRAFALLEEGLDLAVRLRSPELEIRMRQQMGVVVGHQGDLDAAERQYRAALQQSRRIGYRADAGDALIGLGEVALARGDAAGAAALLNESLALFQSLDNRWGGGLARQRLVDVARFRGDTVAMVDLLRDLLRTWQALGDRLGVAGCLQELAGVAVGAGDAPAALRLLGAADAIRRGLGDVGPAGTGPRAAATREAAFARLDAAAARAAWAAGQSMDLAAAIAAALRVTAPGPDGERPALPPRG
jgi:predicted ATPase/transcriptional regulator with XRE-family HTH domain